MTGESCPRALPGEEKCLCGVLPAVGPSRENWGYLPLPQHPGQALSLLGSPKARLVVGAPVLGASPTRSRCRLFGKRPAPPCTHAAGTAHASARAPRLSRSQRCKEEGPCRPGSRALAGLAVHTRRLPWDLGPQLHSRVFSAPARTLPRTPCSGFLMPLSCLLSPRVCPGGRRRGRKRPGLALVGIRYLILNVLSAAAKTLA